MIKFSENVNELYAAMAKAQGKMKNPPANQENPFFRSRYVDLAGILEILRPVYSAFELSLWQGQETLGMPPTALKVTTRIAHSSGQWAETDVILPLLEGRGKDGKNIPINCQIIAATGTYGRRQTLSALAAIATDYDDDGNIINNQSQDQPFVTPLSPLPSPDRIQPLFKAICEKIAVVSPEVAILIANQEKIKAALKNGVSEKEALWAWLQDLKKQHDFATLSRFNTDLKVEVKATEDHEGDIAGEEK